MKNCHRNIVLLISIVLLITVTWYRMPSSTASANSQWTLTTIPLNGKQITESSPAAADFNGDGYKEIVVGGPDGILHIVSFNGTSWSEVWRHQTNDDINAANPPSLKSDNVILSSPAIADLDNDNHLEIIVTVGGATHNPDFSARRHGGVLVYHYDRAWVFSIQEKATYNSTTQRCETSTGGWRGWPQPCIDQVGAGSGESYPDGLWDGIQTTPAIGDLDGDGDMEIVVAGLDRRIHAWHHDGTIVEGWPVSQWNGDALWRGGISSPALGDIDEDGLPEVVVGTMSPYASGQGDKNATLWAINGDSSPVPGFPVQTEQHIHSSPAIGDIDGDNKFEIVSGVGRGITIGRQNIVYAWQHDGTQLPNWPVQTTNPMLAPPALGDIDNDGELEVIIGEGDIYITDNNKLYALNADGSSVAGFPITLPTPNYGNASYPMMYSPVLADIDNDGTIEILVTHIAAWGVVIVKPTTTGATIDATSLSTTGALYSSPLIDDVDNDGKIEIIAAGENFFSGSTGVIYLWEGTGETASHPWPMFHHDITRTGLHPSPPKLGVQSEVRVFHQAGSIDETIGYLSIWNMGMGQFDWTLTSSSSAIQISPNSGIITDATTLHCNIDTTGLSEGWTYIGDVTINATSEGEAISGSPHITKVYVYIGDFSQIYLPLIVK